MALSTSTTGSFSGQINTQNPQTAGQPATGATRSGSVQPGTATAVLTSDQGVALHSTSLPTVSLGASPTQVRTSSTVTQPLPKHHVNVALLAFPVILVLVAVVLVWTTSKSIKSTTE